MDAGAKLSFSYMRHKSVCKTIFESYDLYFFFKYLDSGMAVMQIVEQSVWFYS